MAVQGWGGSLATAIGVAAGAGAAQLGFGYGLGIITWTADSGANPGPSDATWVASLAWSTWIAATSTVAGAVGAQRLGRRPGDDPATRAPAGTLPTAVAAALGALVTVLLVAVPARGATPLDTAAPQDVAAGYAGAGVLLGLFVAVWALRSPPAATGVIATTGWLWLLAVVAVVDGVVAGRGLASAQLGTWQISADRAWFWWGDHIYWPGALLSLGSALAIGALAARRAARSPYRRVGATAAGAAGPFLVAVAYLLVAVRLTEIRQAQLSAHLVAPYAVIAGLAGSVLVAALAQRRDAASATTTAGTGPGDAEAEADPARPAGGTGSGSSATDGTGPMASAGPLVPADAIGASTSTPALDDPPGTAGTSASPTPGDPSGTAGASASVSAPGDTAGGTPGEESAPPRRRAARSTARVPRPRRNASTTADRESAGAPEPPPAAGVPATGDTPSERPAGHTGADGEPAGPQG